MRKLARSSVSAATILAAGFLIPNHAEALIGAPGTASLAAQRLRRSRTLCGAAGDVTNSTTGRSSFIIGRSSHFIASIIGRSFFSPPVGVMGLMPLPQCRPQITRATSTV